MKTIKDFIIKHLPKIIFAAVMFIVTWAVVKMWKTFVRR